MKVLIIRFSSIGDIVITSPIIRCVQEQLNAEVHFLTKAKFEGLVANNPFVSKVIALHDQLDDTLAELKVEDYDVVIDLHKNLRTLKVKKALNAKWYSFNKVNFQKWLFVNFKINFLPKAHLVDRYFNGIASLKVENDNQGLDYFFPSEFEFNLSSHNLKKSNYIVLSIGGTYATKRIPNDLLLSLINRLNQPIVIIGGGEEDGQNASYLEQNSINKQLVNLCNKLSIDESAYVIQYASKIVSGDTGMMHIAAAFNKPIESIWGNTHPQFGMYPYLPAHENLSNMHQVDLKCRPCSKLGSSSCPRGHFNCMKMQNVEEIVKNCHSMEATQ